MINRFQVIYLATGGACTIIAIFKPSLPRAIIGIGLLYLAHLIR